MATLDMKATKAYFWNGVVLTAVFFLCRILTLPPCWYLIYSIFGTEQFMRSETARYVLVLACFVLDVLNVVWFAKLIRGVIKQLKTVSTDANENKVSAHKQD